MLYYTANDITGQRCTITGRFERRSEAEASIERDDESGVFESNEELGVGCRAYHRNGECWHW